MNLPIYNITEEKAYKEWKVTNAKFLERYLRELESIKWADEHSKEGMVSIDKACKWLKENVSKYSYVIKVEGIEYRKVHFTDSLIEDFGKVMGGVNYDNRNKIQHRG